MVSEEMHPEVLDALIEAIPSEYVDELVRMPCECDLNQKSLCISLWRFKQVCVRTRTCPFRGDMSFTQSSPLHSSRMCIWVVPLLFHLLMGLL